VGTRCADHVTPLYPQKLALTSPTGGGRSVDIVRVRTKATEFVLFCCDVEWGGAMIAQLVYRTGSMMPFSNPGRAKIFFPLP